MINKNDDSLNPHWYIELYIIIIAITAINIHRNNAIINIQIWNIAAALVLNLIDGFCFYIYIEFIRHTVFTSIFIGLATSWTGLLGLFLILKEPNSILYQLILQMSVRYIILQAELDGYTGWILYTVYELIMLAFVKNQEYLISQDNDI